jgi:hypothetical protein
MYSFPDIGIGSAMVPRHRGSAGMQALIITGYAFKLPAADLQRYDYLLNPVRPMELIGEIKRRIARSDTRV